MRKWLAVFVCLSLTLAFSACGSDKNRSGENSRTASQPAVTLKFVSSWGGSDTKADTTQQILDSFCIENRNISVVNDSIFGDDFLPSLKTDFVSGNDPDVFGLWPGSDINSMIEAGRVADLTDMLDSDPAFKGLFGASMWKDVTVDGHIYGLPIEIIYEALFINRDLFSKYGVAVPKDYAQLKTAVSSFVRAGVVPIAYNSTAEGTYLYQNIAASIGGRQSIEHPFQNGRISDCYLTAMQDMIELYNLGAFPKDCFTIDSNERNRLFKNKQAAMIAQGSWYNSDVESDLSVDVVPFPDCSGGGTPSRMVYGLGNGVLHISEKAWKDPARRDAAVKLIKYITKAAYQFTSKTGMISNVSTGQSDTGTGRLTQTGLKLIASSGELIGPPDSYIPRNTWEGVIVKDFPYVLVGNRTPQDVLGEAAAQISAVGAVP